MHKKILMTGQQVGCVIVIFGELVVCWPIQHAFTGICKHRDAVIIMISTLAMFGRPLSNLGLLHIAASAHALSLEVFSSYVQ